MPRLEKKKVTIADEEKNKVDTDVVQPPSDPVAPAEGGEQAPPTQANETPKPMADKPSGEPVDDVGGLGDVQRSGDGRDGADVGKPNGRRTRGPYQVVYPYRTRRPAAAPG